jgi:hypothetical protein
MMYLTLNIHCPRCYRDEWMLNGRINNYEELREGQEAGPTEVERVPISTTSTYRCVNCGTFIVIEKPL